ncbi:hypothetical protein M404DRAFT_105014, partial [Pisolithus tinctorius Marx 270]
WERYPHLTSTLLSWLLQHPADRAVLFSSAKQRSAQEGSASLGKPHGRTKKEIHAVVAKVLFANDPEYCSGYEMQPEKLKKRYREQLDRFKSTGGGIIPGDARYPNLLVDAIAHFPWFEECDQMWRGIPSIDTQPQNSTPGLDRAGNFLAIIQPNS